MEKEKRDTLILLWFIHIIWVLVWSSLAYIAFTEKRITIGALHGQRPAHFEGEIAVWAGFMALAAAVGPLWVTAKRWQYGPLFRLLVVLGWVGSAVAYLLWT